MWYGEVGRNMDVRNEGMRWREGERKMDVKCRRCYLRTTTRKMFLDRKIACTFEDVLKQRTLYNSDRHEDSRLTVAPLTDSRTKRKKLR